MAWWRLSLRDLDRIEVAQEGGARVDWADAAKAVSIVLLVLWTLEGTSTYFNQMLILARMPLFFFVSGLFARRVIVRTDFETFVREKVGNLLYLYVLWATIVFATTSFVAWVWWGREIDPWAQLTLLWEPFVPMWFFYGLAVAFLVARLCRDLPVAAVTAVALAAYVAAVATGDWLSMPVFEKIVRLFPWFWLGLVLRPAVFAFVERHWRLWPVPLAAYLLLSYAFFDSSWNRFGPLTFAITAIGIVALLMVSAQLARLPLVATPLAVVGASTLYIYATQHVTIFYFNRTALFLDLPRDQLTVAALLVIVGAGTIFGRAAARTSGLGWLFRAPWLGRAGGDRVRGREGQGNGPPVPSHP
jgi:uncharacterized membrane protein YcfT